MALAVSVIQDARTVLEIGNNTDCGLASTVNNPTRTTTTTSNTLSVPKLDEIQQVSSQPIVVLEHILNDMKRRRAFLQFATKTSPQQRLCELTEAFNAHLFQ